MPWRQGGLGGIQREHQRGEAAGGKRPLRVDSQRWRDSNWEKKQKEVLQGNLLVRSRALPQTFWVSFHMLLMSLTLPPGCGILVGVLPPHSPHPCQAGALSLPTQDPWPGGKWFSMAQQKGFLEGECNILFLSCLIDWGRGDRIWENEA